MQVQTPKNKYMQWNKLKKSILPKNLLKNLNNFCCCQNLQNTNCRQSFNSLVMIKNICSYVCVHIKGKKNNKITIVNKKHKI